MESLLKENLKKKEINKMNVKPKFLNVMKRNLLMLLAVFALVAIASRSFAQQTSPVVGASYTYSVSSGISATGDAYEFSVNTSTSTAGGSTASVTVESGSTGTVTAGGGTNSVTITWNGTDTYYLWLEVTSATTSCTNRRYVAVTPLENKFDVEVLALGTSDQDEYPSWGTVTATNTSDCHVYAVGYDFDSAGGDSDGYSYVFFRVNVVSATTDNINDTANTWDIDSFTLTGGTISTTEYKVNSGSWSTTIPTGLSHTDKVLARATVQNAPAGITFDLDVAVTENEADGVNDSNATNNENIAFTIDAYPDLTGFSWN